MDLTMSYGVNLPNLYRRCRHRDQMLSWNDRPRYGYAILPIREANERERDAAARDCLNDGNVCLPSSLWPFYY